VLNTLHRHYLIMKHRLVKSSILSIGLCLSPYINAAADAHGARVLGVEAALLVEQAEPLLANANAYPNLSADELPQDFQIKLQRFGTSAGRLSREMQSQGLAEDFQCIFRGMAQETGDQLKAAGIAQSGTEIAQSLERIVSMLKDAALVSEAAALTMETTPPSPNNTPTIGQCEAAPTDTNP